MKENWQLIIMLLPSPEYNSQCICEQWTTNSTVFHKARCVIHYASTTWLHHHSTWVTMDTLVIGKPPGSTVNAIGWQGAQYTPVHCMYSLYNLIPRLPLRGRRTLFVLQATKARWNGYGLYISYTMHIFCTAYVCVLYLYTSAQELQDSVPTNSDLVCS